MEIIDIIRKITKDSCYYQCSDYLNVNRIEELPIIDKELVRKNYDQIFCFKGPIIYTHTSGSDGSPMQIAWNYHDYIKSLTSLWRLRAKQGVFPKDFRLSCHAEFDIHGKRIENPIIVSSTVLSLSKLCHSKENLKKYIESIDLYKPKWIYAQPSFVYNIGKYLYSQKPELLNIFKYIELVGELLLPEIRNEIQELFSNSTVINMYGMQEFNGIMYENNGLLQTITDNVYVEIIDEFGKSCNYEEEGDIVVTSLRNSVFPLIRYNTKDRGIKVRSNGLEGYMITAGRSNDMFLWNGRTYDGSVFFLIINEYNKKYNPKIWGFQVVLSNNILNYAVLSDVVFPSEDEMAFALHNIMIDILNIQLPVRVKAVMSQGEFIKGGNKIKYFVNLDNIQVKL